MEFSRGHGVLIGHIARLLNAYVEMHVAFQQKPKFSAKEKITEDEKTATITWC